MLFSVTTIYHLLTTMPSCVLRQNPVSGCILMMRSLNRISANFSCVHSTNEKLDWLCTHERLGWDQIHGFYQWRSTHSRVLFLSCDVFINTSPLKLFIFIWNTMNYFFMVKVVVVASSQQVKCSISLPHDVTVNRPLSFYNG